MHSFHPFFVLILLVHEKIYKYIILPGLDLGRRHPQRGVVFHISYGLYFEMNKECGYCNEPRLIPTADAVSQDLQMHNRQWIPPKGCLSLDVDERSAQMVQSTSQPLCN